MLVRAFLDWFEAARVLDRAEAVSLFAAAYLDGHLGADSPEDVDVALAVVLDDPSPLVRRALASALADTRVAPRALIVALAHDQGSVAGDILIRSPLLTEADLIDCVARGDAAAQAAVARRTPLSARVGSVIAEAAAAGAAIILLANAEAEITEAAFFRLVDRHGADAGVREALLSRPDLPIAARHRLVQIVSEQLLAYLADADYFPKPRAERLISEARQSAAISMTGDEEDIASLVESLRESGELTAGLLLRGLLCGDLNLFRAALVDLTGLSERRVAGILGDRSAAALAALLRKAGLADRLEPAFAAAVRAVARYGASEQGDARLRPDVIAAVMNDVAALVADASLDLMALLRRFEAEALRELARAERTRRVALAQSAREGVHSMGHCAVATALLLEDWAQEQEPVNALPLQAADGDGAGTDRPVHDWSLRLVA